MSLVTAFSPEMRELVAADAEFERLASGFRFTEGPVWDARNQRLIFSDLRGDSLYEWREGLGAQLLRHPSGNANGNTLDGEGRLLSCEASYRRVTRTEVDGSLTVLAGHFLGERLNGVNDLVCAADGSVYFTDTPYGLPRTEEGSVVGQEIPHWGVYRIETDGSVTLIADDFDPPNGIVLTPDGRRLLVDDTGRAVIRAFDIAPDGSVSGGDVWFELTHAGERARVPDGMKLDERSNLYVACNDRRGLWVINQRAELIGFIETPEFAANLAWGGAGWRDLFVTANTSVYRLPMQVAGLPVGGV